MARSVFPEGADDCLSSINLPGATYSFTFLSMKKVGEKEILL